MLCFKLIINEILKFLLNKRIDIFLLISKNNKLVYIFLFTKHKNYVLVFL